MRVLVCWVRRQEWVSEIKDKHELSRIIKKREKGKENSNQDGDVIHSKRGEREKNRILMLHASLHVNYLTVAFSQIVRTILPVYSRECDLYAWLRELKQRILSRDHRSQFHRLDYFEKLLVFIKDLYPISTSMRRENRGQTRAENEGKWQAFLFQPAARAHIDHARHSISE